MAIRTKGSQGYILDPEFDSSGCGVLKVVCATNLTGFSSPREQIDVTCLEDDARQFEAGLGNPGQGTMAINVDPQEESHRRIIELWQEGARFEFAIGLGDGTDDPTASSDCLFELPTTRTFIVYHGVYIADVPIDIAVNAVVVNNVSLQLSGFPDWSYKVIVP